MVKVFIRDHYSNDLLIKFDDKLIVDGCKLTERTKCREDIGRENDVLLVHVNGIYVDGRKDATQTMVKKEDKLYRKAIIEEHYVLIGEPGELYLTPVAHQDGKGRSKAQAIFDAIKNVSLHDRLAVVGSDRKAVIAGNGIIGSLEEQFERSLQWSVCFLRCNEIPRVMYSNFRWYNIIFRFLFRPN